MIALTLDVRVVADETGMPLPGLYVKAYDRDLFFDDLLGGAVTDLDGHARIVADEGDFREFFERRPDVYVRVYAADRTTVLADTLDAVRWSVQRDESFEVKVPVDVFETTGEPAALDLFAGEEPDGVRVPPAVGDSLLISATGLAPGTAYDVEVSDDDGPLFVSRYLTDRSGTLPESVLWPQLGLDDPRSDETYAVADADERWRGREIRVRILRREREVAAGATTVGPFDRPFVLNVDGDGRMLNSIVDGEAPVVAEVHNVRHDGDVRVYLVERQADWRPGDTFRPAERRDGSPVWTDVTLDGGRARASLAEAGTLAIGAYDFVVRPLRYGYEDDDDLVLRRSDVVTRYVTGVVVREEFWHSKVVNLGCVNMMPLAGRSITGSPYFRYTDAFAEGENVWVAADPGALPPVNIGKMVAVYVVASKTAAQWDMDTSLQHLLALGGNGAVLKFKTQAGCINMNKVLVWPAAAIPGTYDVILDFGVGDNTYDAATPPAVGDFIDGYMVPGFRVVRDPGVYTDPAYAHVGGFDYVNEGSVNVADDGGGMSNVPLTARVRFPADVAGATLPGQISAVKASYPMAIIVHGNGHNWAWYDYLLDHWAKQGLVAASIHLNGGMGGSGRARVLFAHIDKLKAKFGVKVQNNIGVLGHSRGGEGVAIAPRLNQTGGLGHVFNGVISLAPTSQYTNEQIVPPWATPYYVIYGSLDGDVDGSYGTPPILNSGFALYDRANGAEKAMLFVANATHNRFLAGGNPDLDWGWLSAADQAKAISQAAHHTVLRAYSTAYFRRQLLGDPQYEELFRGEWVPPSVAAADAGKVKVQSQYRPTGGKTVDDFEGTHTPTSWQTSTIGGAVAQAGLPANPVEQHLNTDDAHSPHDTAGLVARWDTMGDAVTFEVPVPDRDVRSFTTLSFRVGQKYDTTGTVNPVNTDQDCYVSLKDGGGNERSVRVSKFGRIAYPLVRDPNGWGTPVTKSALATVRVPLHAFTIECAGAPKVNLADVTQVAFRYQFVATGQLAVDDLEFTK